ncbi:MAG: corrinoid protein [Dehalococcoidia bacterium]|nr:corrinoid protein [Dehalococcoidia bacterium]
MTEFIDLTNAVIDGDSDLVARLTREGLDAGIPAHQLLDEALIPGITRIGEMFGQGEVFLPELLLSGEAMIAAVNILEPELTKTHVQSKGKFLIGTVEGDVHDIGKNIVVMMLKGNGWEVTDLGVDVSPEAFRDEVARGNYDVVGLSALLTMTMPGVERTIAALKEAGLREKSKFMVGGAPMTQEWADKIGADGFGADAAQAVKIAGLLVDKK